LRLNCHCRRTWTPTRCGPRRAIVYGVIQVDFTLEESTALIGRLVEIDRRLAAVAHA
jgi:hypothetical protein